MSSEYPEHYLEEPSKEVMDALKARRLRAEADPLEIGHQLTWFGPNLEDDVTPPLDYPHHRSTSPNPLRPLHSRLFDSNAGVSAQPWTLTLVEPLSVGVMKHSQVWRAEATVRNYQSLKFSIVVKLHQESFFPLPYGRSSPEGDYWIRPSTRYLVERESQAYRMARDLQGSDLPLCYGLYKFQIPTGEEMVGLVLEDPLEGRKGMAISKFFEREAKRDSLNLDTYDKIVSTLFLTLAKRLIGLTLPGKTCAALRLQDRLHDYGLARVLTNLEQIIIMLSTTGQSIPVVIGTGFSLSSTKVRLDKRRKEREDNGEGGGPWYWRSSDQAHLYGDTWALDDLDEKFEKMRLEWCKLERETGKLEFLNIHEVWDLETREEAEAEDPDAEELDRLLDELTEN